jgi:hypothetical protein
MPRIKKKQRREDLRQERTHQPKSQVLKQLREKKERVR